MSDSKNEKYIETFQDMFFKEIQRNITIADKRRKEKSEEEIKERFFHNKEKKRKGTYQDYLKDEVKHWKQKIYGTKSNDEQFKPTFTGTLHNMDVYYFITGRGPLDYFEGLNEHSAFDEEVCLINRETFIELLLLLRKKLNEDKMKFVIVPIFYSMKQFVLITLEIRDKGKGPQLLCGSYTMERRDSKPISPSLKIEKINENLYYNRAKEKETKKGNVVVFKFDKTKLDENLRYNAGMYYDQIQTMFESYTNPDAKTGLARNANSASRYLQENGIVSDDWLFTVYKGVGGEDIRDESFAKSEGFAEKIKHGPGGGR